MGFGIMETVLLTDFGSTYTKVVAVDIIQPRLLGYASAHTTAAADVNIGLNIALDELKRLTGVSEYHKRFACSSAAGGLRMIACGLVPELTAKAASLASMGAGAKIVGLYSYELTEDDAEEITSKSPDILLLTGGTDGGNKKCILYNAQVLAETPGDFPIIVAGNRNCNSEIKKILKHRQTYFCENVMPAIGVLNIEPTRQLIRNIFLERIVHAKGFGNEVLMPTPAAVLTATEMLAKETGELMAIDVGGATTDVYSITDGTPRASSTLFKGLPEPYAKRTVEGDIGMRYSASGILEAVGPTRIIELTGVCEDSVHDYIEYITKHPESIPQTEEQKALDFALASAAIDTATTRHAGTIEEVYTSSGRVLAQTGKDLTNVNKILMTGGALLNSDRQQELVKHALSDTGNLNSLRPKKADLLIDKHYILAAMGLLSGYDPKAALKITQENISG